MSGKNSVISSESAEERFAVKKNGLLSLTLSAPLKINLALHILGKRADGYHDLESLAVFSHAGDALHLQQAQQDDFGVEGDFAYRLGRIADNLVIKARDSLRRSFGAEIIRPVILRLHKNIPVAAGLGGGSADAATCLYGLCALNGLDVESDAVRQKLWHIAEALGADVPMCLNWFFCKKAVIARGRGEKLTVLPDFPALAIVVVNNGVLLSTKAVFAQFAEYNRQRVCANSDIGTLLRDSAGQRDMSFTQIIALLRHMRNDLTTSALAIAPTIADIVTELAACGAVYSAMSGSGSSCFGVYASLQQAQTAAQTLKKANPHFFVQAIKTNGAECIAEHCLSMP